jgi:hypothetical protein
MSNLLLESVATETLKVPKISLIQFTAEHISAVLSNTLEDSFTGKRVVDLTNA